MNLHLVLADRILDECSRRKPPPFPLDEEESVNAFWQGAFGPDTGYFPGGDPFISDLAHHLRSGHLTRALVGGAVDPVEVAFAWGWLSHVLADVKIHPLIGEAVGERVLGRRGEFLGVERHRTVHIQIEVGLDVIYARRHPDLRHRRLRPVFDGLTIEFLSRAYRSTYGVELDRATLLSSHLAAVRMAGGTLSSIGVMADALNGEESSAPVKGARWLLRRALRFVQGELESQSDVLAYLNPLPPPSWLVEEVDRTLDLLPGLFWQTVDRGLPDLPDYDLDTGTVMAPGAHPCSRHALERLGSRGREEMKR